MFKIFANAFKVKEIRTKLFYVALLVAIVRLGNAIPVPGLNVAAWLSISGRTSETFSIRSLLGGGVGTVFAMGIGPYITASIVMQLLTYAIPYFEQLKKEGQEGINKINQFTRVTAVALAVIQATASVYGMTRQNAGYSFTEDGNLVPNIINLFKADNFFVYALAALAMVTGTIFIMWLSELLTDNGLGNGSSFVIFANILAGFPAQIIQVSNWFTNRIAPTVNYNDDGTVGATVPASSWVWTVAIAVVAGALILFILVMFFAVLVQDAERRIPVQYSKKMVGRQLVGGASNNIPLKVNIAGVMSIIFALSFLQIPELIYGFFPNAIWLKNVVEYLQQTHPVGAALYIVFIFFFTFFYTSFAINPNEMADNIKKNGGVIPGIRSGKPTSDYIRETVERLSWIGALFYALIAFAPILFQWITKYGVGYELSVGFGGTTLLIVSSAALDIVKNLEAMLLMRHYKGFLK